MVDFPLPPSPLEQQTALIEQSSLRCFQKKRIANKVGEPVSRELRDVAAAEFPCEATRLFKRKLRVQQG